ncbi:putative acid phosphatase-like protein [Botrytis fragariae]|uniref:Putative acid phosphatase-like protein n=1 Tax=Botrytis fragariae TaxID=1964551 RepID=A0A8H6EF02_9HELO|nr:putative acid phosphatase-like protein [Botrytis fragariae]KAF5869718.1 putative acid phosphatase-like protein [Botrytis fragariae]
MRSTFLLLASAITCMRSACEAAYVPGAAFDRFFTIWLENQDDSKVEANADILNFTAQGILLENYYGLTHPSQPNYIASVGGDFFGLNHDEFVRIPHNVTTVVDLFEDAGITWKGYFEGLPGPGYMGEGSTAQDGKGWDYVRKHNPFGSSVLTTICTYIPNMLNDGHNTSLAYGANWTRSFLTPLLQNEAFMNNTLILLTYDESETYSKPNRIYSVLLGGAVPADKKGTVDTTIYSHYSILSTLQNNWGLPNLGRYDVGANVFDLCASKTNYTNINLNMTVLNNSLSYPGFLNNDPAKWAPVPVPNLQLIGAGEKGVDDYTHAEWVSAKSENTPYDGSGEFFDGGNGVADERKPVYATQGANVIATATVAQPYSATATPTSASTSMSSASASASATKGNGAERSRSVGTGCGKEVLGLWVALVFAIVIL